MLHAVRLVVLPSLVACGAEVALAGGRAEEIEAARTANRATYEAEIAKLRETCAGQWVVIADGKVASQGDTPESVDAVAPKALHRYLFRVGDEGDGELVANFWYGPRFGGMPLATALGVDAFGGRLTEESPFPRRPVVVRTPGGVKETMDVFLGSVGPPLMLTLDDAERLSLSRHEVPGALTTEWIPFGFRRVTVHVSVPRGAGGAWIAACYPTGTRAQMVDLSRGRDFGWFEDRFGIWSMDPWAAKRRSLAGRWALIGVDRLLAEGATAEEALTNGAGKAPEAYMRYLAKLPLEGELVLEGESFSERTALRVGGKPIPVRRDPSRDDGVVLGTPEQAETLGLALAEAARCVFVVEGGVRRHARMGAVWLDPDVPGAAPSRVAWIAYALPEGQKVWHCEPPPEMPRLPGEK
jgi:hypothetical protein